MWICADQSLFTMTHKSCTHGITCVSDTIQKHGSTASQALSSVYLPVGMLLLHLQHQNWWEESAGPFCSCIDLGTSPSPNPSLGLRSIRQLEDKAIFHLMRVYLKSMHWRKHQKFHKADTQGKELLASSTDGSSSYSLCTTFFNCYQIHPAHSLAGWWTLCLSRRN